MDKYELMIASKNRFQVYDIPSPVPKSALINHTKKWIFYDPEYSYDRMRKPFWNSNVVFLDTKRELDSIVKMYMNSGFREISQFEWEEHLNTRLSNGRHLRYY